MPWGSAQGSRGGFGGGGGDPGRQFRAQQEQAWKEVKNSREADYFWQQQAHAAQSQPAKSQMQWQKEEKELFSQHDGTVGIDFNKYASIPVEVSGQDSETLTPLEAFSDLWNTYAIPEYLSVNIQRCGYAKPTPVQKFSIPVGISGRDAMCCAQTGSGKTCAFLVPILCGIDEQYTTATTGIAVGAPAAPKAIVMAPTRELCSQIHLEVRKLSFKSKIHASEVYGGADAKPQLLELAKGSDIVTATPGRLTDFIGRGVISMSQVGYAVLDEADRMLDMGFEPQIREIMQKRDMPTPEDGRVTFMFSATFPAAIQTLAQQFMRSYIWVGVGQVGGAVDTVTQTFMHVEANQKQSKLVQVLREIPGEPTLIFVAMKRTAAALELFLQQSGMACASIHGDMEQPAREAALKRFRNGQVCLLVATDVASRGLDIPSVAHVVNFDLPEQMESYIHRIGRTGRVGRRGRATSFYQCQGNWANTKILGGLIGVLESLGQEVPDFLVQESNKHSVKSWGVVGNNAFGGNDARSSGGARRKFNAGGGGGGGKATGTRSGPNLPRKRVTSSKMQGQVIEWKGKYGWIHPSRPIDHPAASMHQGNVFISVTDLGGLRELVPGSTVEFYVFEDQAGLGAEECVARRPEGPASFSKGGGKGGGKGGSEGGGKAGDQMFSGPRQPRDQTTPGFMGGRGRGSGKGGDGDKGGGKGKGGGKSQDGGFGQGKGKKGEKGAGKGAGGGGKALSSKSSMDGIVQNFPLPQQSQGHGQGKGGGMLPHGLGRGGDGSAPAFGDDMLLGVGGAGQAMAQPSFGPREQRGPKGRAGKGGSGRATADLGSEFSLPGYVPLTMGAPSSAPGPAYSTGLSGGPGAASQAKGRQKGSSPSFMDGGFGLPGGGLPGGGLAGSGLPGGLGGYSSHMESTGMASGLSPNGPCGLGLGLGSGGPPMPGGFPRSAGAGASSGFPFPGSMPPPVRPFWEAEAQTVVDRGMPYGQAAGAPPAPGPPGGMNLNQFGWANLMQGRGPQM